MHPAAKLQFERAASEFALWRAVAEEERSPAPAWWWQPALQVAEHPEPMPALSCNQLELPAGATYAAGAAVLMAPIITQTSQPWADEFPRKFKSAASEGA
jgi:hypothetical protein